MQSCFKAAREPAELRATREDRSTVDRLTFEQVVRFRDKFYTTAYALISPSGNSKKSEQRRRPPTCSHRDRRSALPPWCMEVLGLTVVKILA